MKCLSVICFFYVFAFLSILSIDAQQTKNVDFITSKVNVLFGDLKNKEVQGTVLYEFEILNNVDSIYLDARGFSEIKYVLDDKFKGNLYKDNKLIVKYNFVANTKHKISVSWITKPKKAMYFIGWEYDNVDKQIWTQGQGKYTSNWMPSIDDMNEKIEFDLSISFDNGYKVISNGKLVDVEKKKRKTTWHYNTKKPMSSYLLALAIGKYNKKIQYSKSNIPLEMYYYPNDSLKVEPTYRYTKQIFDFFEEEINVPYPWQNYKQIPVKDFLYAGMENTTATIFSDIFVIDSISFVDKNYVNVNAHELAHQWFGNLVTEVSGTHHWLQEGFATYYALLAEGHVFGKEYYYWQLYEYAQELLEQDKTGNSTSILNPKSSSTTFYKKGAWILHVLREQVGEMAFKLAVKNYLLKHQFKNVETKDFINEVEHASGMDLSLFVNDWLESEEFHYDVCLDYLKRSSPQINELINLNQEFLSTSQNLAYNFSRYFDKASSPKIKSQIFYRSDSELISDSIVFKALKSNNLKLRQAVAKSVSTIPSNLKEEYETLLEDESYLTIEYALLNLWSNFPKEQIKYLNKTKKIIGFRNKNVRILWLTLALITENFEEINKEAYYKELVSFTGGEYGFETRINAFSYLKRINSCDAVCEENLKQATTHHNWQFSKFAKELLKGR